MNLAEGRLFSDWTLCTIDGLSFPEGDFLLKFRLYVIPNQYKIVVSLVLRYMVCVVYMFSRSSYI